MILLFHKPLLKLIFVVIITFSKIKEREEISLLWKGEILFVVWKRKETHFTLRSIIMIYTEEKIYFTIEVV